MLAIVLIDVNGINSERETFGHRSLSELRQINAHPYPRRNRRSF